MTPSLYFPKPPLSNVVEFFWFAEYDDPPPHALERILPTGTVELIINLHDDLIRLFDHPDADLAQDFRSSCLCGPRSEFFEVDMSRPISLLGVHFKSGGAFPFFQLPAAELLNAHITLDTLWGMHAEILRERLLAAPDVKMKFHTLEQALIRQAIRPLSLHPAVDFMLQEFQRGSHKIATVTDQIGLSPQWLSRIFQEEVGLTPKLFHRVQRFWQVLSLLDKSQEVDWATLALDCGYFDQAHFIHDFRAFAGLSPTTYLSHRAEDFTHVEVCS